MARMLATAIVSAAVLAGAAAMAADAPASGRSAVTAGRLEVDPPTLTALAFAWTIEGDDNRNAQVRMDYRRQGDTAWRRGPDLFREQNEKVTVFPFTMTSPNLFAGSVWDLAPDTAYEVRLTLTDPDGVIGEAQHTLVARTRAEPMPASGGRVYHVYPPDFKGLKVAGAVTSLLAAYYQGSAHADWSNAYPPRVKPDDVILVHAGLYKDNRFRYGAGMGTVFDGTYYLTASGTADKPIVIKAAGDGEVIFDGDGAHVLFDIEAANYNYFEGITIRNTDVAILAGAKNIAGSSGLTVKHSRFENVGIGVMTDWSGSADFYIADNVFIGRHDPNRLMGWVGKTWQGRPGFPAPITSNFAVKLYGRGHVVAYNAVSGFHDGIDHATYGVPDNWPNTPPDRLPAGDDIYGNDISNVADNCIEADGSVRNIRVMRNRCFNSAHRSLSAQPVLGGPVYFYRNIVYNAPEGGTLKLNAAPTGVLVWHNTLIGEALSMGPSSNAQYRNNLILGRGAAPQVFSVETMTNYTTSDYNGFRPNPGMTPAFGWTSPPFAMASDYAGKPEKRTYDSFAAYVKDTGQDRHSRLLDYGVFNKVTAPDNVDVEKLYRPQDFDFTLRRRSAAIDAGVVIAGVDDDYTGKAPDLGALEYGKPEPHYGPR
jgi:hypothetical protein